MTHTKQTDEASSQVGRFVAVYLVQSRKVAALRCDIFSSGKLALAEVYFYELKREVDQAKKEVDGSNEPIYGVSIFNRADTERFLRQRFLIAPSFEFYGAIAGLFDFEPPGCAVNNNLITDRI